MLCLDAILLYFYCLLVGWLLDQILFQYCDEGGLVTNESNPNGSLNNIAGITNKGKNVFGMMPHPERASDRFLSNEDGLFLFNSLLNNC